MKAVNGIADNEAQDSAKFSGITYYAEGTGGVPQSPPQNSTVPWAAPDVVLGTPSPINVKSSVPKTGGKFFTGSGVTTRSDPFATSVNVPAASTYTAEASIDEATFTTIVSGSSPTTLTCTNFTPCFIRRRGTGLVRVPHDRLAPGRFDDQSWRQDRQRQDLV